MKQTRLSVNPNGCRALIPYRMHSFKSPASGRIRTGSAAGGRLYDSFLTKVMRQLLQLKLTGGCCDLEESSTKCLLALARVRLLPTLICGALLAALTIAVHGQVAPDPKDPDPTNDSVQANPGRPTISTPATLSPVGHVQLETGALGAEKSAEFSNRTAIETVLKLSVTQRFEFVAVTEPGVISNLGAKGDAEPGEVFAGLQALVHRGEHASPTISVSYFRRLYASPAPELDVGTNRQSALLLVSFDLGQFHFDITQS
jgi:hypothetical protein